jgi:hypothetical protein
MPTTKPLKHPRLMRVLEAMKPPTPVTIPRDLHQPKHGKLVRRYPQFLQDNQE